MDITKLIKKAQEADKITIGTNTTIKHLNHDKLESVIIVANCPENLRNEIENASKLSNTKIHIFKGTGTELGATARKPYSISLLGIKK